MAIYDIFRRNPIKNIDLKRLKELEIMRKAKSKELLVDIARIEKDIKLLFEKSKEAKSKHTEISLANRIKSLTIKRSTKTAIQAQIEKELVAVSNLIIIKEHQVDLKSVGVWESLQKLPPEQLKVYLTENKFSVNDIESQVNTITDTISSVFKPTDEQEDLGNILRVMGILREGKLEPEEALEIITKTEPPQQLHRDRPKRSSDVFISYSSADTMAARRISDAIRSHGLSEWLAEDHVMPSQEWQEAITNAIKASRQIVFIISSSTKLKGWLSREWSTILEYVWGNPDIRLIPVLLGDIEISAFLRGRPYTNCSQNLSDLDKVIGLITSAFSTS